MNTKEQVLDILMNSSEVVSGEEIANRLNISRSSVWKAIKKLKDEGNSIQSISNKGYKFISTNDEISINNIRKYLKSKDYDIEVRECVTSTNVVLKEEAELGENEGRILISKKQLDGRGRKGRVFYSPENTGIYMSILLRPKCNVNEALFITTASAVAVANTIEEFTEEDVRIKWVNDIYINNRKVSGILTEASIDFETNSLNYVVVGIGVNVSIPEDGFNDNIKDIAGAIFKENISNKIKCRIIAQIINRFFDFYNELDRKNFMKDYKDKSILTGKKIKLILADKKEVGIVIGIDDEAKLVVKLKNGEIKSYSSGEVDIEK